MVVYFLLILTTASAAWTLRQSTIQVQTSSGLVAGKVSLDGSRLSFTGIPYAVATHRFQDADPVPNWKGVLQANNDLRRCPQKFPKPLVTGEEDCLYLNVLTPKRNRNTLHPVMVFIHGGGFKAGSGSPLVYGPGHLVQHDVILVTLNYRLGVLGFLCLGIKEAPGNVGLKDQVQALRWVKKNIRAFGGDPDNITLFGESAGSASVMYHILSPMSSGLFNRVIMESGTAMSYWGTQFEPKAIAYRLAAQMGYNTTDAKELVDIFIQKSVTDLLSVEIPRAYGDIVQSENIFVPCIEERISGVDSFITESPFNILTKREYNKVPVVMGFNSAEGYFFVGKENISTIDHFNFLDALPRDLIFPTSSEREITAARLQELYVGRKTKFNILDLVKYEGDAGIRYPVIATADLLMKTLDKPIYVYKFAYSGLLNLVKLAYGFGLEPGASHADEIPYIFKPEGTSLLSIIEMNMINRMTTMWTNFAKYGAPIPQVSPLLPQRWDPTDLSDPKLLVIDRQMRTERIWNDEAILYWNETYTYYRRLN